MGRARGTATVHRVPTTPKTRTSTRITIITATAPWPRPSPARPRLRTFPAQPPSNPQHLHGLAAGRLGNHWCRRRRMTPSSQVARTTRTARPRTRAPLMHHPPQPRHRSPQSPLSMHLRNPKSARPTTCRAAAAARHRWRRACNGVTGEPLPTEMALLMPMARMPAVVVAVANGQVVAMGNPTCLRLRLAGHCSRAVRWWPTTARCWK